MQPPMLGLEPDFDLAELTQGDTLQGLLQILESQGILFWNLEASICNRKQGDMKTWNLRNPLRAEPYFLRWALCFMKNTKLPHLSGLTRCIYNDKFPNILFKTAF